VVCSECKLGFTLLKETKVVGTTINKCDPNYDTVANKCKPGF